ncbi:MAG TPA: cytochrome c [Terricaulis sp.]|nr:cytochrome c [Terricaulis sp.]
MLISTAVALVVLALASPAAAQDGRRAQAVYETQCAACHPRAAQAPVGDLARRTPRDYAAFARMVRSGEGPTGEMPAFTQDMLSEADLRALHAYILRRSGQR